MGSSTLRMGMVAGEEAVGTGTGADSALGTSAERTVGGATAVAGVAVAGAMVILGVIDGAWLLATTLGAEGALVGVAAAGVVAPGSPEALTGDVVRVTERAGVGAS